MLRLRVVLPVLACACLFFFSMPETIRSADAPAGDITWKKTVLDTKFRSEGVGIADVNKDGKMDVIAGDVWYEAPSWKMHEIRKGVKRGGGDASNGHEPTNYSASFCCFVDDFNKDGWDDVIVIPFPGEACSWYENPKNQPGHWKAHPVWRSACNETPLFADLFGDGKKVLLMGIQPEGQMCWFSLPEDLEKPWIPHPISAEKSVGTDRFYHGLGVGDMNGDGRQDVIIAHGWWEQPADGKTTTKPWTFHKATLGEACADMYAHDMDGDGKMDVISSSAHKFGIWWHQQRAGDAGPTFTKVDLFRELVSETHALHFVDINGDGLKDLVTGKRWFSHGRAEPGADWPAMLYWFEASKTNTGLTKFTPRIIDTDSGVGTQFLVADINGDKLLDVIVSNKKGTFVIEQVRKAK